jgi:hypothetical protein
MAVATGGGPSPATHSIAELITEFHRTTGDVPPLLIGATTTIINNHVYLFGGRLQSTRQISNRVFVLNLQTKVWKYVHPSNTPPPPRYFHSANAHNQSHIAYFGGMGVKKTSQGEELVALADLIFLNLKTMSWEYLVDEEQQQFLPSPRYAHVSALNKNRLVIMGGQDIHNQYLNDIHIFDIKKRVWSAPLESNELQYGAYRSAAVAVTPTQLTPPFAPTMDLLSDASYEESTTASSTEEAIKIHTYSNFSGSEVTRQLQTWKLNYRNELMEMQDQSLAINSGNSLPPPLRFPSAFMCGQQFILAGPHLSSTTQQFQIWALDTTSLTWTKVEAGHVLSRGAWLRGVLAEDSNRFIVFGHPERSMQDDYKDRVHCFEHLASVDIEIFGIYQPPKPSFSAFGQGLGLALLKDPAISDLKIVTTDGQHIAVNSAVLAQRWPTIRPLLKTVLSPSSTASEGLEFDKRELSFPDSYVVLIAFLQFIYTDHLVTAQQHQPQILARLLFIADLFDIPRLKSLATHSLHQMLNIQTATMIYESASLSNAISLQIRALRVMINAKKMMQRQKQIESQQKQQQQQHQLESQHHGGIERPFSPPPTPASSFNSATSPQSSRFLQKYDISRTNSNSHTRPNTPSASNGGFPFTTNTLLSQSTPIAAAAAAAAAAVTTPPPQQQHHRSPSQRSLSTDAATVSTAPPPQLTAMATTPSKSIKMPTFRMRQSTANTYQSDTEYSPMNSNTPSPKITPTSSTGVHKSTSSSFWRQTTSAGNVGSSNVSLKKKQQHSFPSTSVATSKSEGTARSTFSFLNTHG